MSNNPELIVAKSFKISPKEIVGLTTEKIIALSKAKIADNEIGATDIEIIRHSIQAKPVKYSVILGVRDSNGNLSKCEVIATVINYKKLLLASLALLAFLALAGSLWWYNSRPNKIVSGLPEATTEKMSPKELKKYAQNKVEQSNVNVQVYPHVYVHGNNGLGEMYVQNLPINKTGQVATLIEKESGEILYTSKLLNPGYQISNITLNKSLSKGDHQGIIILTFYDLKEEKQVGKANVVVTIHVNDM